MFCMVCRERSQFGCRCIAVLLIQNTNSAPLRQLIKLYLSVQATCLESATYTRVRKKNAGSGIFLLNKCDLLQLSLQVGLALTCWTSAALPPLGFDGNHRWSKKTGVPNVLRYLTTTKRNKAALYIRRKKNMPLITWRTSDCNFDRLCI